MFLRIRHQCALYVHFLTRSAPSVLQRFKKSRPQFPSAIPSLPRSSRARVRKIVTAISGALLVTGLAACDTNDDAGDDHAHAGFAYVSGSTLTTVNGASSQGQASDAARLSVRLYSGAFIDGPNGQAFVNNDLFTSIQATDENRSAEYVINPRAQYSDGKPVTCDDFYLACLRSIRKNILIPIILFWSRLNQLHAGITRKSFG